MWLAAAAAALSLYAASSRGRDESSTWVAVERRGLDRTVPLAGRLRAVNVTEYGPPTISSLWNYKIAFIAPEGLEVEAGEPILVFDTSELEENLRRNLSERQSADESLKKRSQDLEVLRREEKLAFSEAEARVRKSTLASDLPEQVVARRDIEKATIERQLAENEVGYRQSRMEYLDQRADAELGALRGQRSRAAAEVAEIEAKIAQMTVVAERAGVVMYKAGVDGEKKQIGDSAWRGERVIEIPEFGPMEIDAWVLEADAGQLRPGLGAELKLEADPRLSLRAEVISLQQTIERRSEQDLRKVVRLELAVTEADSQLVRPGMRVQGSILVERRPSVVMVPLRAVHRGDHGPFVIVRSLWPRRVVRPVELGRREGPWVEVVSGLDEGEQVLADTT
jgi:hypothetical protein